MLGSLPSSKGPPAPTLSPCNRHLDGFLVDAAGVGDSIDLGRSLDIDIEHVILLGRFHSPGSTLVHSHGMPGQAPFLLQLCIQQVQGCSRIKGGSEVCGLAHNTPPRPTTLH